MDKKDCTDCNRIAKGRSAIDVRTTIPYTIQILLSINRILPVNFLIFQVLLQVS